MRAASVAVLCIAAFAGRAAAEGAAVHKYIGAEKCALCHKSEAKGNQYGKWLTTAHAKAWATLASPKALEIAKKKGITTPPQQTDACVKCHVAGFGQPAAMFDASFKKELGVQCEVCHGPGSDYKGISVMKDKTAAIAAGLLVPDESTCKKCHNAESPTFTTFDYKAMYAKITHPRPKT